jgi:predicted MFS family arabinose efflux permease
MGLLDGARTNFFVESLGLTGNQVLWLEGIREIPGLALMFIAALTMRLPLSRRTAVSILIAGFGYGLYALVDSYTGLLVVAVVASLGLHMWMPLNSSLAMSLSAEGRAGSVMGTLNGVGALATIVGMGALALITRVAGDVPLTAYYTTGALLIVTAGLLILRIPPDIGRTVSQPPRILLKTRYWLYYVLTFFQGSRKQVLNTFGMLVLVETYKLKVWHISLILVVSSLVNLLGAPYLGRLIDRWGERSTVSLSYVILLLCCIGFAVGHAIWFLVGVLIVIRLFVLAEMGLETYVYRVAPAEELTPTLSAGISINHVTSVAMPILAGALLPVIGYEGIFWGTAGLILLSIPFALTLGMRDSRLSQAVAAVEG